MPDVLVHCQCHDCSFKAAGTYAAVGIARRAHCHPDSSFVAIDGAQRAGVWTKYFESPPPLLVDTTRLPQPYSRLHILGATLAAVMVTAGGALFSRWLVSTWHHPIGGWVHGVFMLQVVGGLVYTLLSYANDRRAASIHRLQIVAECNHHIRNALQALTFTHEARTQQGSREVSQIGDSVHRIELTLAEVLPRVFEGGLALTPRREVDRSGHHLTRPSQEN
jgi:hypothetical protein